MWSLAGEEAVSYSLARGKAAAVTRESGEVAAYSLARAVSCTLSAYRKRNSQVAVKPQIMYIHIAAALALYSILNVIAKYYAKLAERPYPGP